MTYAGIPDREHLLELRLVGRHMRAAQRKFFKSKLQSDFLAAKALEKRFDDIIERTLEPTAEETEKAAEQAAAARNRAE